MFPPGRQRMRKQPRLLPDPQIGIVIVKIVILGSGVLESGGIVTSRGSPADFCCRARSDTWPAPCSAVVFEGGFLLTIVPAGLRFQSGTHFVPKPEGRAGGKPFGSSLHVFELTRLGDEVLVIVS